MVKNIKILILLVISLLYTNSANAINNDEMTSFYIDNSFTGWADVYTLDTGKDLLIYRMTAESLTGSLEIRDNGGSIISKIIGKNEYNEYILIKDKLEVNQSNINEFYVIYAYIVDENQDISGFLGKENNFNKQIFTKEQVLEIYQFELIVLSIITLFIFFIRIIGVKNNIKIF